MLKILITALSLSSFVTPSFAQTSLSSLGKVAIPGGVPHTSVKNQMAAQVCWAYAMCGFAEGEHLRKGHADDLTLSPLYLSFYNLYFEFKRNISKSSAYIGATPDEGSYEELALKQTWTVGMVPESDYSGSLSSPYQDSIFDQNIQTIATQFRKNPNQVKSYESSDADKINTNLFNDLNDSLSPLLGSGKIGRPDQTFLYQGKSYNAHTFMSDVVDFNSDDYIEINSSAYNEGQLMKAVAASLDEKYSVPIGLTLVGNELAIANSGFFSRDVCKDKVCDSSQIIGGHEMLIVNYVKDSKGNPSALIVKNSWGTDVGLDVNGNSGANPAGHGFFVITSDYLHLLNTPVINGSWSAMLPKVIASHFKLK